MHVEVQKKRKGMEGNIVKMAQKKKRPILLENERCA